MMNRKMIITELEKRGYMAKSYDREKNGVILKGIEIVNDSNIVPVVYTDSLFRNAEKNNETMEEIVSKIIKIYEKEKDVDLDVNRIFDKSYMKQNIFIGLQKKGKEEVEKRDCFLEGIECYMYLRLKEDEDGCFSTKVSKDILKYAGISLQEAWEEAEKNTNAETVIEPMAKILCELLHIKNSEEMEKTTPFFVISNKKSNGAAAILNRKALEKFGKERGIEKLVVLPSSVHEMILLPYEEEMDMGEMSEMVKQVNFSEVEPTERLTDRAYLVTL